MDLTRTKLIQDSTLEELKDALFLENLIPKLGFNTEILNEQPNIVRNHGGGLLIWQYPNQFSKYLSFLRTNEIHSYLEIGCRWGGTFVLTHEVLKRFGSMTNSVAVDIIDSPVQEYCKSRSECQFIKMNSQSPEFKEFIRQKQFDVIFIDGDHSYDGVKTDYESTKDSGRIFVFHDIVNAACLGVVEFWNSLKKYENDTYDFFEFTEQYPEVYQETKQSFLGIGVAVKKAGSNL